MGLLLQTVPVWFVRFCPIGLQARLPGADFRATSPLSNNVLAN